MTPPPPHVIVYEDSAWQRMLPLVYLRAVFQLLCGMDELLSKVRRLIEAASHRDPARQLAVWCREGLAEIVSAETGLAANQRATAGTLLLNGRGLWKALPAAPDSVREGPWVGMAGGEVACIYLDEELAKTLTPSVLLDESRQAALLDQLPHHAVDDAVCLLRWPWEVVLANRGAILSDWEAHYKKCAEIYPQLGAGIHVLNFADIHLGPGTRVKPGVVIDAEDGPVWVGRNAILMPHVYIQGPAFIGDETLLQPGAIIRAGTTIGRRCKLGGEIDASIIQGFSNKQHDGFLGHSYMGSWVNLGAGCTGSDLKNTYGTVRVPINGREVETGEQFVGAFIGDYAKTGINVSFPTGAVLGFSSNVVAGVSPKFVPGFTWVEDAELSPFDEVLALEFARRMMARRQTAMSPAEERAFLEVHSQAASLEQVNDGQTVAMAARCVR